MKLAIVGSRTFNDYKLLKEECDKILCINTIISGGAKGADTLAERYAKEKGYNLKVFPAKWHDFNAIPCKIKYNKYGPYNSLAGYNRNDRIVRTADIVIAFWDGKSTGTASTIKLAKKYSKRLIVIEY